MTNSDYQAVAASVKRAERPRSFMPFKYSLGMTAAAQNLIQVLMDAHAHFKIAFDEDAGKTPPIGISLPILIKAIGVAEAALTNAILFMEFIILEINALGYFSIDMTVEEPGAGKSPNLLFRLKEHRYEAAQQLAFRPLGQNQKIAKPGSYYLNKRSGKDRLTPAS